jgi:hypothetical protein
LLRCTHDLAPAINNVIEIKQLLLKHPTAVSLAGERVQVLRQNKDHETHSVIDQKLHH